MQYKLSKQIANIVYSGLKLVDYAHWSFNLGLTRLFLSFLFLLFIWVWGINFRDGVNPDAWLHSLSSAHRRVKRVKKRVPKISGKWRTESTVVGIPLVHCAQIKQVKEDHLCAWHEIKSQPDAPIEHLHTFPNWVAKYMYHLWHHSH